MLSAGTGIFGRLRSTSRTSNQLRVAFTNHRRCIRPLPVLVSSCALLCRYHPQSIPAPYNHSNVDSDEVLYYVEGQFMSRKGIERASITFHPSGIPHGPHPGTYEGSIGQHRTEELAVMIDTFRPLKLTAIAADLEDKDYPYSWTPALTGGTTS